MCRESHYILITFHSHVSIQQRSRPFQKQKHPSQHNIITPKTKLSRLTHCSLIKNHSQIPTSIPASTHPASPHHTPSHLKYPHLTSKNPTPQPHQPHDRSSKLSRRRPKRFKPPPRPRFRLHRNLSPPIRPARDVDPVCVGFGLIPVGI